MSVNVPLLVVAVQRGQRFAAARRPVLAVDQQDIGPAVAIGVEEAHAGAERFGQELLPGPAAVVGEFDPEAAVMSVNFTSPGVGATAPPTPGAPGPNPSNNGSLSSEPPVRDVPRGGIFFGHVCRHRFRGGRGNQGHAIVIVDLLPLIVIFRAYHPALGRDGLRRFLHFESPEQLLFPLRLGASFKPR